MQTFMLSGAILFTGLFPMSGMTGNMNNNNNMMDNNSTNSMVDTSDYGNGMMDSSDYGSMMSGYSNDDMMDDDEHCHD